MTTAQDFKQRIWDLAALVNVEPKEIHLRYMTRKWGSCSSKGRLTYNKEIIEEPGEVQLDAILHELLHLKYPNHGKMFHVMMRVYRKKVIKSERSLFLQE